MDSKTQSKEEALREACSIGNTDFVNQLLDEGVDVNSQNKMNGWTSLHWASKRGHASIVSSLLKYGADPNIKTHQDETAFSLAEDEKVGEILRCIEFCKKEDARDKTDSRADADQTESKTSYQFVPNYLKHPAFPHGSPSNFVKTEEITYRNVTENSELVLKVRVVGSDDFIEIDLNCGDLSYDNLLNVCCEELEVSRESVTKLRKLPNTIIRKDKDVQRLQQFQELEVVLKNGPIAQYMLGPPKGERPMTSPRALVSAYVTPRIKRTRLQDFFRVVMKQEGLLLEKVAKPDFLGKVSFSNIKGCMAIFR